LTVVSLVDALNY